MKPVEVFANKAPLLMDRLMREFGFLDFQAAGDAGNAGHESNGFTSLHELGQPEGRGGYGWYQWTGPRRKTFLAWCQQHGLDWRSDEANIGFHLYEMNSDHATVASLLKTKTLEQATLSFERNYERAGVVNMASRNKWAKRAMDAYRARAKDAPS